ncbi:glycoside hydrolase family 44 protein [Kaistia granuli]|uniref:glycoside hydrolase family 44 protein n=1 Tax=Kaistia granuli TaxID=363259 RepID=UPI00036D979C|nr:glycoside hydrolase family 44 protein [Kaistia granuli]
MNRRPTRRAVLGAGLAAGGLALGGLPAMAQSGAKWSLRVADGGPGRPISPLIYGSNEIGTMDGGAPSAELDRAAGVTARRLGGNLMTTYNWVNNAANAGKDYQHANGPFLLDALGLPKTEWTKPALLIEAMHEASLAMGAKSLVTVPLAGSVAADFDGPVPPEAAAPSPRFVPIQWTAGTKAGDPIVPAVADIPQLLARLVETYGGADSERGIYAYALDNEPGLWFETHPRIVAGKPTIRAFLERSLAAARAIKRADPAALVFGPVSWGATEMASFQDAPDWNDYRHHGSFVAAYLDAFRQASEQDGIRLLDALDVHWYPYSNSGDLFRTENPALAAALLEAPRTLTEPGFREESWVPRALPAFSGEAQLGLPLLPSLEAIIAATFPGTALAITEFNYGGAGQLASGLALADVLGRFGRHDVVFASHWGSLEGWLGEAYRLYRAADAGGQRFGDQSLEVTIAGGGADLVAYAAGATGQTGLHLVVINKSDAAATIDVSFETGGARPLVAAFGFDDAHPQAIGLDAGARQVDNGWQIDLPARSARRFAFA